MPEKRSTVLPSTSSDTPMPDASCSTVSHGPTRRDACFAVTCAALRACPLSEMPLSKMVQK